MTQQEALDLLREIRGLERLHDAITRVIVTAGEWRYGLIAIDDRLRWCRYCLSLEHSILIDSVELLLDAEPAAAAESVNHGLQPAMEPAATGPRPCDLLAMDLPHGRRVH